MIRILCRSASRSALIKQKTPRSRGPPSRFARRTLAGSLAFFYLVASGPKSFQVGVTLPRPPTWNPAANVTAVGFIVRSEHPAERWLLVGDYEQGYHAPQDERHDQHQHGNVRIDEPFADQDDPHAEVHRIADPAVRSADDEAPRRIERSGRSETTPGELPQAGDCDRRAGRYDEPTGMAGIGEHIRPSDPSRDKPGPERHEERADDQRANDSEEPADHGSN